MSITSLNNCHTTTYLATTNYLYLGNDHFTWNGSQPKQHHLIGWSLNRHGSIGGFITPSLPRFKYPPGSPVVRFQICTTVLSRETPFREISTEFQRASSCPPVNLTRRPSVLPAYSLRQLRRMLPLRLLCVCYAFATSQARGRTLYFILLNCSGHLHCLILQAPHSPQEG